MTNRLLTNLSLLFICLLCTCVPAQVQAQTFNLEFDVANAKRMNITESPSGTYAITTTGNDPWVAVKPFMPGPYDPETVYVISFDYAATNGLDDLEIFYGPVSPARKASWTELAPTTGSQFRTFKAFMKYEVGNWDSPFQAIRFDISKIAGANITIKNVQLRAPTATEVIPLTLNPNDINPNATTVIPDGNGGFDIATSGADPWVATQPFTDAYDPAKVFVVTYDYVSTQDLDDFRIFFGEIWTPARMALFGPLPAGPTKTRFTGFMSEGDINWTDGPVEKLRFDFGRQPGKNINVSNFVLREPTQEEQKAISPPVVLETVNLELNVNSTSSGMEATETGPFSYQLNTSGNDPWISSKPVTDLYDIEETYIFEFEYQAAEAYNLLEIFFGPPINATQLLNAGELPAATEWTTFTINPRLFLDNFQEANWTNFRFDFGKGENVTKQVLVRNLKLRKPTAQEIIDEQNSDKFISQAINLQFNEYRTRSYPDKVTDVVVDATEVTISGNVSGAGAYFLAEVDPEDYGFNLETYENVLPITVSGGAFTISQPRFAPLADRNKDRLYARWVVVTADGDGTYTKTSPLSWATDITYAAENNLPEDKAETIKGLDGLSPRALQTNFDDLTDLDIKSMKINLLLNGVFAVNAGANTVTHEFNGKTYNINQNFVNGLDDRIIACTNAGIKTAFVLLIPIRFSNPVIDSIFRHPDASLGLFSMANVATPAGIEHYTMLVDFLSERYSRPDGLYGRMDQWIIHNEVDAHTSWTHAGQKPAPLYTQIYDRSMRMVHFTIRKHDPTAKVFSSFTKHFASKVGGDNGPNFRSKEILTVLGNLMKLESDYEWGIGWHSYPTNLFNPKVWEDNPATTPLNFNAAQITPRNLEVIDAYVRQESVLYNGKKVRTILLSENGFSSNTERNPNANETTQAAALAYFWKKAYQRLPSIENIQLHRWVDNPNEAGLEFGLWTNVPGTVEDFNTKKLGWYVWEAAGTPNEDNVFDAYLPTVGINDWSEIQFQFATETTPHRVIMNIVNCDSSLDDVLVSFNGEHKFPQADGTVSFYNVASNVDQPYTVSKGGVTLASDTLLVGDDLELLIDLQAVSALSATGVSSSEVALEWVSGGAAGATFAVERSEDGGEFSEIARVTDPEYTDATVTSGSDYAYRVALVYENGSLSCYSDPATVTAPFIVVEYRNGDRNRPTNNKIAPQLRLRNDADMPVGLNDITLRYWFTAENLAPLNFFVDYAALGTNDVSGSFTALTEVREGATHYLEVSFNTSYQIPANGNTGEIKTRIAKSNYTDFNEADDYSVADNGSYLETAVITAYRNGELIWGTEPGIAAVQEVALKVLHKNPDATGNNKIAPRLQLVNDGNLPVDLEDVTLRYWFTPEGTAPLNYALDYAQLPSSGISGQFVDAGDRDGATKYFEVSFAASLGQLAGLSTTGDMNFRLTKSDWSNFDEVDDHSFQPRGNAFLENADITAYIGGQLVYGTEPAPANPPANLAAPSTSLQATATATLYPNPASTYADLSWSTDIATATNVFLTDARGARLSVRSEVSANRLRLLVGGLPTGIYLLSANINGDLITERLVVRR